MRDSHLRLFEESLLFWGDSNYHYSYLIVYIFFQLSFTRWKQVIYETPLSSLRRIELVMKFHVQGRAFFPYKPSYHLTFQFLLWCHVL